MDEVEQILTTGDLDLTRNSAQLKEIRAGAWTEQQVRDHFAMKEKTLEEVYDSSKLPYGPPEQVIKSLLLSCLEHPDKWDFARFTSLFLASSLYCSQAESRPAHLWVSPKGDDGANRSAARNYVAFTTH